MKALPSNGQRVDVSIGSIRIPWFDQSTFDRDCFIFVSDLAGPITTISLWRERAGNDLVAFRNKICL